MREVERGERLVGEDPARLVRPAPAPAARAPARRPTAARPGGRPSASRSSAASASRPRLAPRRRGRACGRRPSATSVSTVDVPGDLGRLRQIADRARALRGSAVARAARRRASTVAAVGREQPGEALQQGRLARAVGPADRGDLARAASAAVTPREAAGERQVARLRASRQPPPHPQQQPEEERRADQAQRDAEAQLAPPAAAPGTGSRRPAPAAPRRARSARSASDGRRSVSGRTRCGTISPTKPMIPATATPAPTVRPTPAIISACSRRGSTPSERAAASPSVSASSPRPAQRRQRDPGERQRRGEPHLAPAAVGQRAHQPGDDLAHREGRWARG